MKEGVDEIEVEIAPNVRVNVLLETISSTFSRLGRRRDLGREGTSSADAAAEPAPSPS